MHFGSLIAHGHYAYAICVRVGVFSTATLNIHYCLSKEKYEQQSGGNAAYSGGGGGYGDHRNPRSDVRPVLHSLPLATQSAVRSRVREAFDDLQADAHTPLTYDDLQF